MKKIWILALTPSFRYGRWVVGLTIFLTTYFFQREFTTDEYQRHSTQLFFSCLFAYIVPVFSFIIEKSERYFESLRLSTNLSDAEFQPLKDSLSHRSVTWLIWTLSVALLLSIGQLTLILGSPMKILGSLVHSIASATPTVSVFMIWITMTTVVSALTANARVFAKLGRDHVDVSVLNRKKLMPFGDLAVISTLAIIGALALFPLMMIDGAPPEQMLPGLIATALPMIMLFITPLWPLHKRLVIVKQLELDLVLEKLGVEAASGTSPAEDAALLSRVVPLLSYQRELNQMSTWPIDMGSMSRLSLYLIIPPLTWVGAALIENLVDGFL